MTASARIANALGILTPIALAALKLTTSSKRVGCSTGISPGLLPRKISTADRRYLAWLAATQDIDGLPSENISINLHNTRAVAQNIAGSRYVATRSKIICRLLNSRDDDNTLSACAPDRFAASIARPISSGIET